MATASSTKIHTRLFVENTLAGTNSIDLDKDQSHYLANVMRVKVGDKIALFNGRDGEWACEVTALGKRHVTLDVGERTKDQSTEPDLWLAFAPIKKARLDFIAQKATELGVSHMVPVLTRRTIVDRVKTERMTANAVEAAEQCERMNVPTVGDPVKLNKLLDDWPSERKIMFCDEDLSGKAAHTALKEVDNKPASEPWAILIGPEGGFDGAERDLIRNHPNCLTVSLGPRILRADTAAMAAISLWQSALGDW